MVVKRDKGKRVLYSILGVVVVSALIFGSGFYSKKLGASESVHFAAPFPAGNVVKPTTLEKPNGGKVMVKPITIDLSKRGIFKKIFNPTTEKIVNNNLTNVDTVPHRIGIKLTDPGFWIDWEVRSNNPFDEETQTFSEPVSPGASIGNLKIDLVFHFSEEARAGDVWYDGSLVVFDTDTGEDLTTIPVKFVAGE